MADKKRRSLDSPSRWDPTVRYDRAGSAVNGEVAVFAGVGNDISASVLHSGVSQAVIGTLADFEDSRGRSIAERSPEHWAELRRDGLEEAEKPKKNVTGLDSWERDEFGCWIWTGAFKGQWNIPSYNQKAARRLVYLRDHGLTEDEAPERFVHAACGDRRCVNPDHAVWRSGSRLPAALLRPEIRLVGV